MPVQRRVRSLILATAGLAALAAANTAPLQAAIVRPAPPAATPAPTPEEAAAAEAARLQAELDARRTQRQRDLFTILQLAPTQTTAFDAYVASQSLPRPAEAPTTPGPQATPDPSAAREARLARQRALRQRRAAGQKAFYALLNPGQRQVFDALNRLRESDIDLVRQRLAAAQDNAAPRARPKGFEVEVADLGLTPG